MTFNKALNHRIRFALCAGLSLACWAGLRAETLEVQSVTASEPGKPGAVPASLAKYKEALSSCAFAKFADAGAQTVTLSATAPKAAAPAGGFSLDLVRKGAGLVDVTVMKDNKPVMNKVSYNFAKEKTKRLELPSGKNTTTIVFITQKE